jgi:hypothetical protein
MSAFRAWLNSWRIAGECLIMGDLEAEHGVGGHQIALHRHRPPVELSASSCRRPSAANVRAISPKNAVPAASAVPARPFQPAARARELLHAARVGRPVLDVEVAARQLRGGAAAGAALAPPWSRAPD